MIPLKPRNDYLLIRASEDGNEVLACGPLVDDVRPGDKVVLPDYDEDDETPWHEVGEDLILVREQFVLGFDLTEGP